MLRLLVILMVVVLVRVRAADVPATSPSRDDIVAAIALAVDGDRIVVPEGAATYTSGIRIFKAISIAGAGIGSTLIFDDVVGSGVSEAVFSFEPSVAGYTHLSGFTFRVGTNTTKSGFEGTIQFREGPSPNPFRVSYCHFDRVRNRSVKIYAHTGVIDHCRFDPWRSALLVLHTSVGGASYGDGAWATPYLYGTTNAVYVEDCTFAYAGSSTVIDGWAGGRVVLRFNTLTTMDFQSHGLDSGQRFRSMRAMEIYGNVATNLGPTTADFIHIRGGTAVICSNTVVGPYTSFVHPKNYRKFYGWTPFWGADGKNPWDTNSPTLYASGTHSGASGVSALTVAGAGWTDNQWTGYALTNVTQGRFSEISGNTSDTIQYVDASGHATKMKFNTGDTFGIRKVIYAMDQPGMGSGTLITIASPAWPLQVVEPMYVWANTLNGAPGTVTAAGSIVGGVHYTNIAKPGWTPLAYPHPLVSGTSDTEVPTITITSPTSNPTYATSASTIDISGTAADNVAVTSVIWSNDRGGSGVATGTTSWSVTGIALQTGVNTITVTARDAVNNTATDLLTVTYTPIAGISASSQRKRSL